jgi:hypothetical protein
MFQVIPTGAPVAASPEGPKPLILDDTGVALNSSDRRFN